MFEISVIIPSFNRSTKIVRSIESVLSQEGQGEKYDISEILVVDDCSVDDTEKVVLSIPDTRIKYIKLSENRGAGGARNAGAEEAGAEWIAFQDSDDIWVKDKLKKQVEFATNYSDYDMICGAVRAWFTQEINIVLGGDPNEDHVPFLSTKNFVSAPTILIKREVFLKYKFDENFRALEEWEFALRYAEKNAIGFVDDILVEAEVLEGGVSSNIGNEINARCKMIAKNRKILEEKDVFNHAMEALMRQAFERGILEKTGELMAAYLKYYS